MWTSENRPKYNRDSSNAPITPKGLSFCRDAGLSSAPSRGSIAVVLQRQPALLTVVLAVDKRATGRCNR